MKRFFRRFLSAFTHRRDEADLARELSSHLALLEDDYRRRGMTSDEAALAARRAMGSVVHAKDRDSGVSIARLADDVTTDAAAVEVGAILAQLRGARIDARTGAKPRVELIQLQEELVGPIRRALFVLAVAVGLVLLIACTNVASLLLARTSVRDKEIGVRMALGAPRKTVLALVLRQSLLIAVAGMTLGLAGAVGLTRYLSGMLFELTPLEPTTFVVVIALFAAVAALASLVPARRATRIDPVVAMRSE